MSTRRYHYTVTDYEALQAAYPQAVTATTIPEHTEYEAHYSIISKLLACGITVPGIELVDENPAQKVKRL